MYDYVTLEDIQNKIWTSVNKNQDSIIFEK